MTRSPAMLGVALFLQLMPQVLLAPWAGVLADRYDKRLVLAASHVASAALKLMVAALTLASALTVPVLMGLLVVVGCANALQQAAAKTIVSALVEEDDLVTAISLNSVIFNLAGFVGPALAGIAIAYGGIAAGFGAAAVAALLFLFTLRALPSAPAHTAA